MGCLPVRNHRQPPFFLSLVLVALCPEEPRLPELSVLQMHGEQGWALLKLQDARATGPTFLITLWSGRWSHGQIIAPRGRMYNRGKHILLWEDRKARGKDTSGRTPVGGQQGQGFNTGNH